MRKSNQRKKSNKRHHRITRRYKRVYSGGNKHTPTYPPESIKNYIHHVVYINLDSRTDRREQIEKELKVFNKEQIHRIPGIVPEVKDEIHRTIACAQAHINAVQLAMDNNWENTLILEDDSIWANIDKAYPIFEKIIKQPYHCIMLGSHNGKYVKETFRVLSATSGASYLLHNSHYKIFRERLQAMITNFKPGTTPIENTAGDVTVFGPLQKEYEWFMVAPPLMKQLAGRSDRTGINTNYTKENTKDNTIG